MIDENYFNFKNLIQLLYNSILILNAFLFTKHTSITMAKIKDNTVQVVFISLLLDLLAFTVILPLLPSLLDYYKDIEHNEGLYFKILHYIQHARKLFDAPDKVSTVLYGG